MSKGIQAVRGIHDTLPEDSPYWQLLEATVRQLMSAYGYSEIRLPILEKTELFKRSIGEVTDIVEKEMYTFEDRNGENLSLRPEGTAGCVRAAIEHGMLHNQVQRLWYTGPMFRHERPQKGRYRQFYQIGVETFGMKGPDIDAEVILMTKRLWDKLGLTPYVSLQLNTLGTPEARHIYKQKLVDYLENYRDALDEDSQRRLNSNPLRILDSKDPKTKAIVADAPQLVEHLDDESRAHFDQLQLILETAGLKYEVNPHLVRGLDYYSRTVFEWVTDKLGSQGTVCAGGRYDSLVEMLGGKPIPAVGFAMGVERLISLIRDFDTIRPESAVDVYMVLAGDAAQVAGMKLAEFMRENLPDLKLMVNCGGGSFKSQMKKADKSGAKWGVILGDNEVTQEVVALKPLREEGEQQELAHAELINFLKSKL